MEKYNQEHTVGRGSSGTTFKVSNKVTGEVSAMKCIPRRENHIDKTVEREINIHKILQHPNIVKFKEVVSDEYKLGIVMEYVEKGLGEEVLFNPFDENKARTMFQMLIAGVNYFHYKGICHRDLKLENILLTSEGVLKICDFGSSKSSVLHSTAKTMVGTQSYWAPEVQLTKIRPSSYDGKGADVWSCGIVLYKMLDKIGSKKITEDLSGIVPYNMLVEKCHDSHNLATQENIDSWCKMLNVTEDCKLLICSMLKVNPKERITIEQIKKHPWYIKNLPLELTDKIQKDYCCAKYETPPYQSDEEIHKIIWDAEIVSKVPITDENDKVSTSSQFKGGDRPKETKVARNASAPKTSTSSQEREDRVKGTKRMKHDGEAINSTSSQLEGEDELKKTKEKKNGSEVKIPNLPQKREEGVEYTNETRDGAETTASSKLRRRSMFEDTKEINVGSLTSTTIPKKRRYITSTPLDDM